VREDPKVKDLLYLGTERGVSYSRDGGKNWQRLKLNLPTVAVHDLAVKDSSLAVGTLGRSIWIFDHLTVLREMSDDIKKADAHLFSVPDAIRWRYTGEFPDKWTGENPPRGAVFYYWLKEEQKNDITVDVLDSSNKVIATLSSVPKPILGLSEDPKAEEEQAKKSALPKKAGVQVAYWDLTYDAPEMVARSQMFGGAASGPMVLPGTYTLRLNVEGKTYTSPVKVIPDPRVKVSEQELKEQLDLAMSLRNDVTEISKQIKKLQSVRKQIRNRTEVLKGNSKAAQLIQDSEAFDKKADVLESKLHNAKAEVGYDVFSLRGGVQLYGRLVQLYSTVADGDGAPTQGMRESYEFVKKDWKAREAELNQLLGSDLKTLNDAARAVDAPTIYVQ
jgi:hypothetical protein